MCDSVGDITAIERIMFLFRGFTSSPAITIRSLSRCGLAHSKHGCFTVPSSGLLRQNKASQFVIHRGFRLKKGTAPEHRASKPGPKTQPVAPREARHWSLLGRPLVFTVGFSALSFGLASIWQYENMRQYAHSRKTSIRKKAGDLWREWSTNTPQEKVGINLIQMSEFYEYS